MSSTAQFASLAAFSALAAILCLPGSARADTCAQLSFHPAKDCAALQPKLELSACKDSLTSDPSVSCAGGQAKVVATGKENRYEVSLKQKEGSWGAQEWVKEGDVAVIPLPKEKESVAAQSPPQETKKPSSAKKAKEAAKEKAKERVPSEQPTRKVAAAEPVAKADPTPAPSSSQGNWSFTATFDGYYAYNFNRPATTTPLTNTSADAAAIRPAQNTLRYYDWYSKQLGLNLVEFSPKYTRGDVTLLVDFDFGQMADISASTAAGSGYVVDEVSKHIGQAILTYAPSSVPNLVIEIGKMATHVGLEVIKAKDNWNYSRSVIFGYGGPAWHTGVHVGYGFVPGKFAANLYLYNGWNTLTDVNSGATLGAQLKFTPSDVATLVYNYVGGPEQTGNISNKKQVHEANATVNVFRNLAFGLEMLSGSEQGVSIGGRSVTAKWYGASLAAKWQATPSYALSPRFELYKDEEGYTVGSGAQTITTYTLTNSFQVTDGLETRLEGRLDHSTVHRFASGSVNSKQDQATVLMAFIYSM
jgi:hypothetical protein